jgi:Xaa-Pro dipeptidase
MLLNKREFLKFSGALGVTAALPGPTASATEPDQLRVMTGHAVPISVAERQARVAKAQRLMQESGIDALLLEAGSALVYFTGVRWWRS